MANKYSCSLTTITSAVDMEFGGLQPLMLLLVPGRAEERGPHSDAAAQGVSLQHPLLVLRDSKVSGKTINSAPATSNGRQDGREAPSLSPQSEAFLREG